jgi:hypothetical protein
MRTHNGRATALSLFALAVVVALAGCGPTSDGTGTAVSDEPSVSDVASASPSEPAESFPTAAFADISEDPVSEEVAEEFLAALREMARRGGMTATVMSPEGTWSGATGKADGVRDVRVDDQFAITALLCNDLCNRPGKTRVRCRTPAGHLGSKNLPAGPEQCPDQSFCLWGGLDSNQRPTDYEFDPGRFGDQGKRRNMAPDEAILTTRCYPALRNISRSIAGHMRETPRRKAAP